MPDALRGARSPTFMDIRYTATPAAVRAQLRFHLRHSARAWLPFAFVVLAPLLFGALPTVLSGGRVTARELAAALAIGGAMAVFMAVWAPRRVKRDERTLTISPAGIRTAIGRLQGEVPWPRVAMVGMTDEYVFIMGRSSNGFVIPSRAFDSPDARAAFIRLVEGYYGKPIVRAEAAR
jgi:YcxB-like protein